MSFALAHAVVLGLLLMALTWFVDRRTAVVRTPGPEAVMSAASVPFVCVGMAGVMILVGDSLARALAIGAAIALLRFRVKMQGKFLGVALFYAALTGMACGVAKVEIAWALFFLFSGLIGTVLMVREYLLKRQSVGPKWPP